MADADTVCSGPCPSGLGLGGGVRPPEVRSGPRRPGSLSGATVAGKARHMGQEGRTGGL